MKEPWRTPFHDLRLRLTHRGRAELWVKRRLIRLRERLLDERLDVEIAEVFRRERGTLQARFDAWDDAESRRIREELLDDLQPLYPGVPRTELLNVVREFRRLARDLPVEERAS